MSTTPTSLSMASRPRRILDFLAHYLFWLLAPVLLLVLALVEPRIASSRNLLNLVTQASYLAVFASAQMLVILIRGFDLSLGSTVSLISVLTALALTTGLAEAGLPTFWLIAAGVGVGLLAGASVGVFNGFCTAILRVNPFIVTLGSLGIAFGVASMASGGRPVFDLPEAFSEALYSGQVLGLSAPVWIALVLCLALQLMLSRTVFGRSLYLIGSNPRAAEVAGVPVARYVFITYVLASLVVAVGAMMLTGRTSSGEPNLGGSLLLPSIAAAVVGGISLQGGTGGVGNAVMGALFISVLSNGMNLIEVDGYLQDVILGLVILVALYLDRFRKYR